MRVIKFNIINKHCLKLIQKACVTDTKKLLYSELKHSESCFRLPFVPSSIQPRDVTYSILYSSGSFRFLPVSRTGIFSFRYKNVLLNINNINQSVFVFFVNDCKLCQYFSICSFPLTVIKFLTIFMFIEVLIEKLFQSFSARTGLAPMHDAYVARRVVNHPLDQVFVCQVSILCIDLRHNI